MHQCKTCSKDLTELDDAIVCSGTCSLWYHIECTSITKSQYKVIKTVKNISWCCNDCTKGHIKCNSNSLNESNEKRIEDLLLRMKKVESLCDSFSVALINIQAANDKINNTLDALKLTKINTIHPVNQSHEHQYQIRLSGLPELQGNNNSAKPEAELQKVNHILKHLEVGNIAIKNLWRIGVFNQSRTRTMILQLNSIWDVRLLLSNAKKLVNYDIKGLFLRPDLSAAELVKEKAVLKQRWDLIQAGVPKTSLKIKSFKLYRDNVLIDNTTTATNTLNSL